MARSASRRLAGVDHTAPLHEDLGAWRVTYHFGRTRTGVLAVARLEIAPLIHKDAGAPVPGDGIVSTLLARVRIAAVRRRLRAVTDHAEIVGSGGMAIGPPILGGRGWVGQRRGRGRPPVVKRSEYVRIRDRYLRLIETDDAHPAKTLAAEFHLSREALRCRLYRMRKMGLFTRTR